MAKEYVAPPPPWAKPGIMKSAKYGRIGKDGNMMFDSDLNPFDDFGEHEAGPDEDETVDTEPKGGGNPPLQKPKKPRPHFSSVKQADALEGK